MNLKQSVFLLAVSLTVMPLLADDSIQSTNFFPNERAQASYAMGASLARILEQRGIDGDLLDQAALIQGLTDTVSGKPSLLTPQQINQILRTYLGENQSKLAANQSKFQQDMMRQSQELAAKNLADGQAFLARNKNVSGVMTLPDGLQYKIVTDGSGPSPAMTSKVMANYSCSLMDGTVIESTATAGHSAEIPLNSPRVPKGLSEAITQMKVGSVWDVWLPASLAIGMSDVPPNAAVKFHIELLGIATNPPPPAPPILTSDIIAVPSAADISKGAKPHTITQQELQQLQSQAQTNQNH
jgi:FKBP-type peptidyl-prolyl cis-trans isomerase